MDTNVHSTTPREQVPHYSTGTFCFASPLVANNSVHTCYRWAEVELAAGDNFFAPPLVWEARRRARREREGAGLHTAWAETDGDALWREHWLQVSPVNVAGGDGAAASEGEGGARSARVGDVLELGCWKMWVPEEHDGQEGAEEQGSESSGGGEDGEAKVPQLTQEEWEAQDWVPLQPLQPSPPQRQEDAERDSGGGENRDMEEAWRRWELTRYSEAALAADPFQNVKPLAYWGWRAHERRSRYLRNGCKQSLMATKSPGCADCKLPLDDLVLENDALSFDFWPTSLLKLPGGAAGGGFIFVSQEGDAVIFNVSSGEVSPHAEYDALRCRRAREGGLREARVRRERTPQAPDAPPLRRGHFDPAHSESLSEMMSELDRNIDSEGLADVWQQPSSEESREAQAAVDEFLAHHRAAGGLPPEPIDVDDIH